MTNFLDIALPEEPVTASINPAIVIGILAILFIAVALVAIKVKKK